MASELVDHEQTLQSLRISLSKRGSDALVSLQEAFHANDEGHTGTVSYAEFEQVLALVGIFLPLPQLTELARVFDPTGSRSIPYADFVESLAGELTERRLNMVSKVFASLPQQEGIVKPEHVIDAFNPEEHPKVLAGDASAVDTRQKFIHCLQSLPNNAGVSLNDFMQLWKLIGASIPLNDNYFVMVLERCFGVPEVEQPEGDQNIDNHYLESVAQVLKEKIRQKTRGQESETHTLMRVFRHFDLNDCGTIDFRQWSNSLERFGIIMPEAESAALFKRHDLKNRGCINYDDFVKTLYGL